MRKQLLTLGLVMVFAIVGANIALAQGTDTEDLDVTATVVASCRITSTTTVAFGTYDPTDAAANDNGAGDINFRCVRGTDYEVYIVGTRTMVGGTNADDLDFELYSDAGRTAVFEDASPSTVAGTAASNAIITTDVYGRIAALQDVTVDSYSTTLTATVEW